MPKRFDHPITVTCTRQSAPHLLSWDQERRRERVAQVLDSWREIGAWWEEETERQVYLVVTTTQKSYEVYQDLRTGNWYLARVFD